MLDNHLEVAEYYKHSLMTRHVSPVGNLTRSETLTPHGWAQLIALERRGLSTWNEETVDALYCFDDCGIVRANDVYDVALDDAIVAARADIVAKEKAPSVVYELQEKLRTWGNPYAEEEPKSVEGSGDDALFVGDDTYHRRPAVLEAALKLLAAVGVEPVLIGVGRNSGFLASSLGLPKVAQDLAQANIDDVSASGAGRVFVLSPGDYFALGQMYDDRLGLSLPDGIELVEVTRFLASALEEGRLSFDKLGDEKAWAYVDPTHAVRVKSREAAPRSLLKAVLPSEPKELFWREGRAYPCGNLALEFTQPKIADMLTRSRLEDAVSSGAQAVVTEDAGSLVHLERHAADFEVTVKGLYELLVAQLSN
jgi:Fe-S oxidoreductase